MDEIFELIEKEQALQETTLRMIPSENYTSKAVREAVGSVLMHKYSEGQAGKRYYQGNEVVDEIERLCQKRALATFGLDEKEWGVNVQALSGAPANLAVYTALLEPGERIMAMYLPDGGHLSHGWQYGGKKVTLVSKIWEIAFYHVNPKTEVFDYDEIERLAKEIRPKILISGGTAYPREINHERMGQIAHQVGAYYLADVAHEAGLIAGGANQSPFPFADIVTMTTHKTLRGPRGALIFGRRKFQAQNSKIQIDLSNLIDRAVFPGLQGGPHNETIAGIAVALKEDQDKAFKVYAKQVVTNAQTLAKILGDGGLHIVSGGTDKHLVLIDLRDKGISGWVAAWAMEFAGMIMNRNTVPNETASPFYPSGLRLGTPFITSRGMKETEMVKIGAWMLVVIDECKKWKLPDDKADRKLFLTQVKNDMERSLVIRSIHKEVSELCVKFPL